MRETGLEVRRDDAGNLFGGSGDVWCGSHLDSVPGGGRFDGALGVVAALEVVRPGVTVVVFRDEERGCAGSRAVQELPRVFLELHIEQGPVLVGRDAPVGVVTAIAGIGRGEVSFEGAAGHAGTTPMAGRRDALAAAAEYVLRVREVASAIEGAVATVGRLEVSPGAVNVIPARVTLSVDARAPDADRFARLLDRLGFEPTYRIEPVAMAERLRAALRDEITARGLPLVELPSGAGHDAGLLASRGVESGMLFVRSLNGGISHSPVELSSEEDVAAALDVLDGTLARVAA